MLFDEATSALDNKSECIVQQALERASAGRTCLTIAHRLTTIENSNKIAVVNRGKIVEEVNFDFHVAMYVHQFFNPIGRTQRTSTKKRLLS